MTRHRHPPAIGVAVTLVVACPSGEGKAVADQGTHHLPSGRTAQLAVVDGHRSEGDRDQQRLRHRHVFGNWFSVPVRSSTAS
jgi:hypothetical protein